MRWLQKFRDFNYNRKIEREIKEEFKPYHAKEKQNEETLRKERHRADEELKRA